LRRSCCSYPSIHIPTPNASTKTGRPKKGFFAALRALCDRHGILLVADEVQSGVGRAGAWWAHQIFDGAAMRPDLLIFAKGVASGYPLAGLAAREGLLDKLPSGVLGGTYGGNAVACAAAVATLEVCVCF
jgi:4-aminobutyrate aminotransferase